MIPLLDEFPKQIQKDLEELTQLELLVVSILRDLFEMCNHAKKVMITIMIIITYILNLVIT
jgi:hypothetical protein